MKWLRRIASGSFNLSMAHSLDTILKLNKTSAVNNFILPVELGLSTIKHGTCTSTAAEKIKNGNSAPILCKEARTGDEIWVSYSEIPIAIGKYEAGAFLPKKVFNLI